MPSPLVIQDACVLINLLATGRFKEIAQGIGHELAISKAAASEALFLRDPETGEKEPIELKPYIDARLLDILTVETLEERTSYVAYAAELDDGEAMSIALAECRQLALATDDRKARRLISTQKLAIELWSTVDVLKRWQAERRIAVEEMQAVLNRISQRARYFPKPGQPERIWWDSILRG
jgi:predicted nucleic acid-binding protein